MNPIQASAVANGGGYLLNPIQASAVANGGGYLLDQETSCEEERHRRSVDALWCSLAPPAPVKKSVRQRQKRPKHTASVASQGCGTALPEAIKWVVWCV